MYEENLDLDSSPALWTAQEWPRPQMEQMKKLKLFLLVSIYFALLWLLWMVCSFFPLHFSFTPLFQNNATVLFVVLAPYSTPIAHRMTSQWNSQPGMTRNLSISFWFGSYITSYIPWHKCLLNPVTDWKSLISIYRLHLVLCINMCLNLPKAWVLCCIPGTISILKSV